MIIKSMSRKEPSFTELYDYITREGDFDPNFTYTQNFILRDRENILNEFENNSKLLPKRANGNYLYHEIISITRAKGISEKKQKAILQDLVCQYSKGRAKDCLVFGGLHDEKDDNLHFHLIISANKQGDNKRFRLKKSEFDKIKKQVEIYTLERYPELEQKKLISKDKTSLAKTSNKEQELKRRTKKPSQKDIFKSKLTGIFDKSLDKQDFFDNLQTAQIEIYTRGKTIGFLDIENNRKHRLKTLGLESEFEAINNTLSAQHKEPEKVQPEKQTKAKPKKETPKKKTATNKNTANNITKGKPKNNKKSKLNVTAKEWIKGDFSERETRIKKEKIKDVRKKRKKIIPEGEMTVEELRKEKAKQWIKGDFSDLEARERMKKWQDKHNKEQAEIDKTKSREEQTTFENVTETAKEWVMGDFTNRENRTKKEQQAKDKKKWQSEQQIEREERSNKVKQTIDNCKPESKEKATDKDEQQKRRDAINKMRSRVNKSKEKDKGKGKSK